ncbi:hypothetical protein P170DRAFT_478278 [Aspergillus steynii IBT 23096]|uniref:Phytocyanin domain-containing protein n=1 Tax=Aspergillus steynii IBT 23096 TaxID=1392250 RepID=A0A2I2G3H8_9EURO|nr:uncharacterized protein P170DRAFT_478278 [Aspergillus steynii IBT 23096]PLB47430.1 hypothetical protein P170DRAFT_478278 [Aspergillus steynii IBT 23096]
MPSPVVAAGPKDPIQTVIVGGPSNTGGFNPPTLQVDRGSRVHFDFLAVNHTLTESTFDNPCQKKPGALIDTDFNNANPDNLPNQHPFDYTFESNEPRYFYCKQGAGTSASHCAHGEVFAVNINETVFTDFRERAMASDS